MTTNKPTKVVIEITAEGWSESVYAGETVIAEKRHIMKSRGWSQASDSGDWYDSLTDDFEGLAEALEDMTLAPFGIAGALYEIEEERS